MTSIVTISCPQGIVLGADSRITYIGTEDVTFKDNVPKIFKLKIFDIVLVYWGCAPINKSFISILDEFEQGLVVSENVDSIAKKLKEYLENNFSDYNKEMGFHIAGIIEENKTKKPRIRHVFHVGWCEKGIFINENSNNEYHHNNVKFSYVNKRDYIVLFNGENSIANAFFNFIPALFNDRQLRVDLLNLDECKELIELVIKTNSEILQFYVSLERSPTKARQITGGKIVIVAITKDGFKDLMNYTSLKTN